MHQTISIRPAEAKDVEAAIPLIYSSGPDAWDYVFADGKYKSSDFIRYIFVKRGNSIGYKNHFVACDGNKVIGTILIYSLPSFHLLNAGTAFNILALYKT